MDIGIGDVIDRWKAGDARALGALKETARFLAAGLSVIVNSVNPASIFIGGEITDAWELFEAPIADTIRKRALTPRAAQTEVVPEPTTRFPRLHGATALITAPSFAAPTIA
jgi:predicted NBD/HSP70 family sugar kinase